jgi:hypothetical protein
MKRFLPLLLLLYPLAGFAQNASVRGAVQDPSGAVITKASVEFRNQDTGVRRQVTTNQDGFYQIEGVDPGKYDATVDASGFKTLTRENVVFHVGDKAQIDFKLQVGASSEHVDVDGSGLQLNTTDASVSTVIDRRFVENMPLNGRSFQDLISMTPGIVTQNPQSGGAVGLQGDFSVNGQRTESNYYTVDGVTGNTNAGSGAGGNGPGTSGSLGGSTALGTTQSLLSVDALQEFRVEGSTYSAEYGRSPGGQFSLATRSGTASLHGGIFDYLRNDFFDANDWFNDRYGKRIAALRQNDFGGTLDGPVIIPHVWSGRKDTFFFFSYEGLRLTQPIAANIQYVPDNFMRQQAPSAIQPLLNAYPIPNGIDYGSSSSPSLAQFIASYSLPSSIDSTSIRLDHTISPKLALFFRYVDTPSSTSSRADFALATTKVKTATYTVGATSQFSNKLSNEFRLGYDRSNSVDAGALDTFGGAVPIDLASSLVSGAATQSSFEEMNFTGIGLGYLGTQNSQNQSRQWNLVDTVDVLSGHHNWKFGVDYRRVKSPTLPAYPSASAYFFSAHSALNNSADDLLLQQGVATTPIFNETAVFAQDEWRISSSLSLSTGLRWEVDPPPTEAHGNDAYTLLGNIGDPSTLSIAPRGTALWKTSWFNFAPRLGVAWSANRRPGWETVLRTGAGVFFDTGNQLASDAYYGLGFSAYKYLYQASLPEPSNTFNFSPTVTPPYTGSTVYAFPSHLQLPYSLEWNVSLEQAFAHSQSLTISYVGSNGRRLTGTQEAYLGSKNPEFGYVIYFPNGITSNYQALQTKFQRSVSRGLQALISYTWSHAIDFGSTGTALPLTRGGADFDVRNNLQAGLTYDLPAVRSGTFLTLLTSSWGIDGRVIARTAFPVTLFGNFIIDPATGSEYEGNVDLIPGQPLYIYGTQYPGGRKINPAAFVLPTSATDTGDAPRNLARGFGEKQVNLAVRREFRVHDPLRVQFRAETFNIFNHANFGYIDTSRTDLTFGQATKMLNSSLGTAAAQYQQGGPRSMQFSLKLLV